MSERSLTEAVFGALPDDYKESPEQSRALQAALSRLEHRERLAIEMIYGVNGSPELERREVAGKLPYYGSISVKTAGEPKRIGIGIQALRAVEHKALRKLRHPANRWLNHCPWCHRNGTMNCRPSN